MSKRKPNGYWKNRKNIERELKGISKKLKHFPSWIDLKKLKEFVLIKSIRNYHNGSLIKFRKDMGYDVLDMKPFGFWQNWSNLKSELENIVDELGHFPDSIELRETGRSDILNAVCNFDGLIRVREKMGYGKIDEYKKRQDNYFKKLENKLGQTFEDFLMREYDEVHHSTYEIAKQLKISQRTVSKCLKHFEIPIRTISESRLPRGVKKLDKKHLIKLYVDRRKSTIEIAEKLGVNSSTVGRWLEEYNIPIRSKSERLMNDGARKPSESELRIDYINRNMNQKELGEKYKVCNTTIRNWLREYEIPIRSMSESKLPLGFKSPTKRQLEKWFVEQRISVEEIGEKFNVSKSKIQGLLRNYNIKRQKKILNPGEKKLREWYITEKQSSVDISDRLSIGSVTVRNWLRKYEIPIRSASEAKINGGVISPSYSQLRKWYVEEGKTSFEISELIGVSDVTVGKWLKNVGIDTRDIRGIYDSKKIRQKTFKELLKISGKKPREISSADFEKTKRDNRTSFSGLLGWYRRNYNLEHGTARDFLIKDLCRIPLGESIHYRREPRVKLNELADWNGYKKMFNKMFKNHPELKNKIPSSGWMNKNGYYCLTRGADLHGGMNEVRKKLGQLVLRRQSEYLKDFENIRRELEHIMKDYTEELNGGFPRDFWLVENGYSFLSNAIRRHHGGYNLVKQKMGYNHSENSQLESLLENYAGGNQNDE